MIVTCRNCGISGEQAKGQGRLCPKCSNAYQISYRAKHKAEITEQRAWKDSQRKMDPEWVNDQRKRGRDYWAKLRHEAVMAYGGYKCACCGETEPKFLTLDHVFNDGAVHRKQIKNRGSGIFKWLKDHGYPSGFQILCMNCNHGKALNNGICPHKSSYHANCVKTGEAQTG